MVYFHGMKNRFLCIAFVLISCAQAVSASLVALWEFEETSGAVASDTVGSLPVDVVSGADLSATGRTGSGLGLANDVTTAARAVTSTAAGHAATQQVGDFSITLWLQPTAADLANNFARIVDASSNDGGIVNGYRLFTGSTPNRFRFLADNGAVNTDLNHTRDLMADTWTLLSVRYDIDGNATANVLFDTDAVDASFVSANSVSTAANGAVVYGAGENTNFGSMDTPTINNNELEGVLDDVAFFDHVLTDAELVQVYQFGAASLAIPEPSNLALLVLGSVLLVAFRRR